MRGAGLAGVPAQLAGAGLPVVALPCLAGGFARGTGGLPGLLHPEPGARQCGRGHAQLLRRHVRPGIRQGNPGSRYLLLQHGRITHGFQLTDPDQRRRITSYYGEQSGVALAIRNFPRPQKRIGVVGLGTGTTAAFGEKGDYVRIYEINEEVRRIATSHFTFIKDTQAVGGKVDVIMGDARLSMEREEPQRFDVLALDAFSSDAIPVHLLTKEAVGIYGKHLAADGVLAVHISNRYLDLEPVVENLAKEFGYERLDLGRRRREGLVDLQLHVGAPEQEQGAHGTDQDQDRGGEVRSLHQDCAAVDRRLRQPLAHHELVRSCLGKTKERPRARRVARHPLTSR